MTLHFSKLGAGKRQELIILALCFLIGFVLRFYAFDHKSLWIDEIHTFNDSRDNLQGQLRFYKEYPAYLHPPVFFILTHLFYPFPKPERDLRIIPLLFGILSVPMIYYLAKLFSPQIALPCTLSLTFMTYHISLSQEGRPYTFILFLAMFGLYFFIKHLNKPRRLYLFFAAAIYALLFLTHYTSILFIFLSQILWFYGVQKKGEKPHVSSLLVLNGFTLLFCTPWILFIVLNYRGQPLMHPFHIAEPGSFSNMLYLILNDWTPHAPLMISSAILLILIPFFPNDRKNAIALLIIFILPVVGLCLFCKIFNITHFVSSKYFINFLPFYLISLYLSLQSIEIKLEKFAKLVHLKLLFVVLFIASNLVMLPVYYRSEKQDLRGLVTYLKTHLHKGDKIFDWELGYMPGILHYFGAFPKGRHQSISLRVDPETGMESRKSFVYQNRVVTMYHSRTCCDQYVTDGGRLWIVAEKDTAKKFKQDGVFAFKAYFDGSVLNFKKFPYDASIFLFLYDPKSPQEKGIDLPIE